MQDASLLTIQVSEVLKIDKADPIQVVQTEVLHDINVTVSSDSKMRCHT